LLGRDDFDLIWENIQAELLVRDPGDRFMNSLDRLEIPIIAFEKEGARRSSRSLPGADASALE
jgi:hypothetical protein